jgi:hypothetical protein
MDKLPLTPKDKLVVAGIYTDEYYTTMEDLGYIEEMAEPPLYDKKTPIDGDKFISGLYYRFFNRKGKEEVVSILAGEKVPKSELDPEARDGEYIVIPTYVRDNGSLREVKKEEMLEYYRQHGTAKEFGKKDIVVSDFGLLHFSDLMIRAKLDDLRKKNKDTRDFFEY